MLTCKDVTQLCASETVFEVSWTRHLAVRFHLLMCQHCRRYVRQLRAIGVAARHSAAQFAADHATAERLREKAMAALRTDGPTSPAGD